MPSFLFAVLNSVTYEIAATPMSANLSLDAVGMDDWFGADPMPADPSLDAVGMDDWFGADPLSAALSLSFDDMWLWSVPSSISRYRCVLTGLADGMANIELPIATLQSRLRQGDPSYIAVTVPGMDYAAAITARSNGEIVIYKSIVYRGVEYQREELARVTLEAIRTDEGGKSKTITLSGHKNNTYSAKSVSLAGVTYKSLQESGKLSFRCAEPDLYLRPGDTCNYGDDSFVTGLVQYTISPKSQSMTVTEADT